MWRANISSAHGHPAHFIVQISQIAQHVIETEREVSTHVLKHAPFGAHDSQRVCDVGPEMAVVVLPSPAPRMTKRLARVPAGDDVDGFGLRPVDGRDVAQVGDAAEAVGEDFARALVDVGHPRSGCAENLVGGVVEPAVPGEQAPGPHARPTLMPAWTRWANVSSRSVTIMSSVIIVPPVALLRRPCFCVPFR